MTRFPRTLLLVILFAAAPVHAVGLPDTGQDTCYNNSVADAVPPGNLDSIARDTGTHPRQDCRYGPDAAAIAGLLTKNGGGGKGFDYTKIANNGSTLAAGAALGTAAGAWACTKDNITGLTWEVKTAASTDLRYSSHTYTWLDSQGRTNGGDEGGAGTNTCNATLPGNHCNTEAFITAVNDAALCTYTNWRLPTRRELLTLVYAGGSSSSPSIDPSYFPNTIAANFWSDSTYVPIPARAWYVFFNAGDSLTALKISGLYVRLVRGGPF